MCYKDKILCSFEVRYIIFTKGWYKRELYCIENQTNELFWPHNFYSGLVYLYAIYNKRWIMPFCLSRYRLNKNQLHQMTLMFTCQSKEYTCNIRACINSTFLLNKWQLFFYQLKKLNQVNQIQVNNLSMLL